MNHEAAKKILEAIYSASESLDAIAELATSVAEEDEIYKIRKLIAQAIIILNIDILMPIIKQHPDLDPDKEYFENKKNQE